MKSPSLCQLWLGLVVMAMVEEEKAEGSLFNQPDWGFRSYLDEDYTLHCDHSHLSLQPANFIRWELSSGELLEWSSEKYQLTSDVQGQVVNMHLTVRNVQDADSGVYLCHVYATSTMQVKLGQGVRGLNIGGHLYRQPFDRYRHSLLLGGCLAAGVLVLLSAGCLIYKFRYRAPPHRQGNQTSRLHVSVGQQHHHENGQGNELSVVLAHQGGEGEWNRSFQVEKVDELHTKL